MADIMRVSVFGTMPSGEEWSVNPVYNIGGDFGSDVTPAQAQTIAAAISALGVGTAMQSAMNAATALTGARVEARTHEGTLETQAESIRGTPLVGTGAVNHPFQTAWVISLRTPAVGGSGRGRLYWPATGQTIGTADLRVTSGLTSSFMNGAKAYLLAIEAAIEAVIPGVNLCVWSRTLALTNSVNQVQVGNVLDTQRRRRDTLIELYTGVAYP